VTKNAPTPDAPKAKRTPVDLAVKAQQALDAAQRKLDAAVKKHRDLDVQAIIALGDIAPLSQQVKYLAANPLLQPDPTQEAVEPREAATELPRRVVWDTPQA